MGLAVACLHVSVRAQTTESKREPAAMTANGSSVRWQPSAQYSQVTMTVSAPDGQVFRREFQAGSVPEFFFTDKQGNRLPDGQYTYELRFIAPQVRAIKDRIAPAPDDSVVNEDEDGRLNRRRNTVDSAVQSGSFALLNGVVYAGNETEPASRRDSSTNRVSKAAQAQRTASVLSANTVTRLRNHRLSLLAAPDQVIADDLIVQGSACVGLDCVNNESFGFDTIRLKENNTRIKFDDTSTSTGFPNNDWQLTANDSTSGGANKFSVDDITNSKTPFTITANAPTNSIFVDSSGRLGLRTATPVLDVHANTSNTPAIRMEQNNSGGFTAQTWDIAGNEANFFVRDVTGGSRLPFRIRPGAPTSSIDISSSGQVGIGTASPVKPLHVISATAFNGIAVGKNDSLNLLLLGYDNTSNIGAIGSFAGGGASTLSLNQSGGRVGIGTTAPDQILSVNGDASKTGGGSWQSFSDERLKNIKGRFNTGLRAVMQLQPLRYEYKRDNALGLKSEGDHIGFGAQALQKVIPEAVTKNASGYLMVNNDPILWTMLNAIKEQQQEIAQLKGQIQKLQASHKRRR
jgi:hypothetical protein